MKFWQKNYFITLFLFSAFLVASFILLLTLSEAQGYTVQSEQHLAEQHYIAQLLSNDAASVAQRQPEALPALAESYVNDYFSNGVLMMISNDDRIWANRLPVGSPELAVPNIGERMHILSYVNEVPYLFVTARLPQPDTMVLTCAFNMSEYFESIEALRRLAIITAASAILLLAVILYPVLRKLYRPMERLTAVATTMAEGDFSARSNYHSRDEVGRLAHSFNYLAENVNSHIHELEATAEEKQNLADTLAHEIRTPLTAVEGYAQYLQYAAVNEDEKYESLQYIIEESRRLSHMCGILLKMASLRGEKAVKKEINLTELIRKAHRTMSAKRRNDNVRITTYKRDDSFIKGESALIESLITNLLDNAVKACSDGGMVRVYTEEKDDAVLLIVEDDGRGMNEEQLKHLGEQFYRPDKARSRQQGGAGLGIALCFEIAKSHDATIEYQSSLGEGTRVSVTFINTED